MSTASAPTTVLDIGTSAELPRPIWRQIAQHCAAGGAEVVSMPAHPNIAQIEAAVDRLSDTYAIKIAALTDPAARLAFNIVQAVLGSASLTGMDVLLDKGRTRELCDRHDIAMPPAVVGPGGSVRHDATELLRQCGVVFVKDPHGWAGIGVHRITSEDALARNISGLDNALVEGLVEGEEYSVEAVATASGVRCLGWVAKGHTSSTAHPLFRVRYAPAAPVPELLREPCARLLPAARFEGVAEIELVVRDGRAYVIECNPRLSGVTGILSLRNHASSLAAALRHEPAARGCPAVVETMLPDEGWYTPECFRAQSYLHPSADSGYEPRLYLWGTPSDLVSDLTGVSPDLGGQLSARVAAATALA